jgi:2-oxo-4-hydroxy-4-carboxy-5-ureidoimidazoline decarboxylase
MTLAELNALSLDQAQQVLSSCCGVTRWVDAMIASRPFHSLDHVLATARAASLRVKPDDWREAFAHHARIGERAEGRDAAWSIAEQSAVARSHDTTRKALAEANQLYERRFGHIFLTYATGKSGDEILNEVRQRLLNDSARELTLAADEQRKITQSRLRKLLGTGDAGGARP